MPAEALLGLVALLALVNLVGSLFLGRRHVSNAEFLFALLFDLGMLTAQLYLSGRAGNPFIAFYLVQVVLGAILLATRLTWKQVVVTTCFYALLTYRHRPLVFPPGLTHDVADFYTLGHWLSFAVVAMLLVMFIGRIDRNLGAPDGYLAGMRQHAAEEDNIVRMGLFASGAAHELGTPLASLAVIPSDWQRMPPPSRRWNGSGSTRCWHKAVPTYREPRVVWACTAAPWPATWKSATSFDAPSLARRRGAGWCRQRCA